MFQVFRVIFKCPDVKIFRNIFVYSQSPLWGQQYVGSKSMNQTPKATLLTQKTEFAGSDYFWNFMNSERWISTSFWPSESFTKYGTWRSPPYLSLLLDLWCTRLQLAVRFLRRACVELLNGISSVWYFLAFFGIKRQLVTVASLHDGVEIILQLEAITTAFDSLGNPKVVSIEQQLWVFYILSYVIYK